MANIRFTCPHCSFTTQLASSTEGMKGNCPSCKTEVVITPDNPESEWLVISSGLKSETPTKLKDSEIIALIGKETIAGGAQLSDPSNPSGGWISLSDSHFYQHVEELKTEKNRQREKAKEKKLARKALGEQRKTEENQKRVKQAKIDMEFNAIVARQKERRSGAQDGIQDSEERPSHEATPTVAGTSTPNAAANSNLSQCKDCGGTVSIQATTCPHCGTPNPSGTTGVLVIKRQHRSFVASLAKLEVTFNSNPLGKLKNGETRRWNVEPGTHKLGIGNQYPKELDITIHPNRETIVEFKATADQAMQVAFGNRLTGMHESPIKILSIKNR